MGDNQATPLPFFLLLDRENEASEEAHRALRFCVAMALFISKKIVKKVRKK